MSENHELTSNEIKLMIEKAPNYCPITGLEKCEIYIIGNNVVYLPYPPYNAYTLPTYEEREKAFYRTCYDLDDKNREEIEFICDLEELENHPNLVEIKRLYNIK